LEEYTIGGLIDPRTHRIMFVFKSLDPEATVRHHNEHPTEEWKERTKLNGTPKRDWLQDLHNNGLEAAWVILETVQTDAAGAKAARCLEHANLLRLSQVFASYISRRSEAEPR
jgi:hypothetical protein